MDAEDKLICIAWGITCFCFYARIQHIRRRTDTLRVEPLCDNITRRRLLAEVIEVRICYNSVVLGQACSSETLAC